MGQGWKHLFNVYTLRERLGRWRQRREARRYDRFGDGGAIGWRRAALPVTVTALAIACALYVARHPPLATIAGGEIGVRTNRLSGGTSEWRQGSVLVVPGVHEMRVWSLRDQTWRALQMGRADGPAPLQSVEGLSLGADVSVRWALDPAQLPAIGRNLPMNVGADVVDPALQGTIYKIFARYTVREIFSTRRAEIARLVEVELKPRLAQEGLILRSVQIGKIDLPADYRRGMDQLLAEELASEKMRFTLELKDKRVRETELDAKADKARREIAAEAAGREQVIAAKAQEEAMKHVLPFKQRQIEQRQLEAEAQKVTRIKAAEAGAQARRIEAAGESEARQRLADAEVYRMDKVGRANAEQMDREGVLVSRHPLLIQKTVADKLSDKIQVIIAPPSAGNGFIAAGLLGAQRDAVTAVSARDEAHAEAAAAKERP
jgi:regulator of protease activity HflC (stomatin/prohibitin superfamily)